MRLLPRRPHKRRGGADGGNAQMQSGLAGPFVFGLNDGKPTAHRDVARAEGRTPGTRGAGPMRPNCLSISLAANCVRSAWPPWRCGRDDCERPVGAGWIATASRALDPTRIYAALSRRERRSRASRDRTASQSQSRQRRANWGELRGAISPRQWRQGQTPSPYNGGAGFHFAPRRTRRSNVANESLVLVTMAGCSRAAR